MRGVSIRGPKISPDKYIGLLLMCCAIGRDIAIDINIKQDVRGLRAVLLRLTCVWSVDGVCIVPFLRVPAGLHLGVLISFN